MNSDPENRLAVQCMAISMLVFVLCACSKVEPHQSEESSNNKTRNVSAEMSKELGMSTETVAFKSLSWSLHATGQVKPEVGKDIVISARVSGRVIRVDVVPGESVSKGQVLASIDSQELSEIEAELIEAKAAHNLALVHENRERQIFEEEFQRPKALIEAKTQLDEAKAQMDLADREFKRQEELYKERISAAKDYYIAKAKWISSQASYKQKLTTLEREEGLFNNKGVMKREYLLAQAETNKQQKHVNTLRQRLIFLGMSTEMLDDLLKSEKITGTISLKAPMDGIITHRDVDPGEVVERNKQAFTITDLSTVSVVADIPEVELRRLKLGTKAAVKTASFPYDKFEGTISYISSTINPELRTVPIRVRLTNPKLKLKSNMFAEIDLLQEPAPVLACPKAAVQEHDGHKVVYMHSSDGYIEREIETGNSNEKYFEVISGLKEGDKIVTSGSLLLKTEFSQVH